jgi:hypothetical protein
LVRFGWPNTSAAYSNPRMSLNDKESGVQGNPPF